MRGFAHFASIWFDWLNCWFSRGTRPILSWTSGAPHVAPHLNRKTPWELSVVPQGYVWYVYLWHQGVLKLQRKRLGHCVQGKEQTESEAHRSESLKKSSKRNFPIYINNMIIQSFINISLINILRRMPRPGNEITSSNHQDVLSQGLSHSHLQWNVLKGVPFAMK